MCACSVYKYVCNMYKCICSSMHTYIYNIVVYQNVTVLYMDFDHHTITFLFWIVILWWEWCVTFLAFFTHLTVSVVLLFQYVILLSHSCFHHKTINYSFVQMMRYMNR